MKTIQRLILLGFAAIPAVASAQSQIDFEVRVPLSGSTVSSLPPVSVSLDPATLASGNRTMPYSFDFSTLAQVSGGTPPYTLSWSIVGAPPAGLSLDPATGVLSGTPTVKDTASFDVVATHADDDGQETYSIVVGGMPLQVTQLSVGTGHACAVTTSGGAKCWGDNLKGQLGNNSVVSSTLPVDVSGLAAGVASISAGEEFTCAVTTVGEAKCWGEGSSGRLGNGAITDSTTPVQVTGLTSGVTQVATGSMHACAIQSGAAKCWGEGGSGRLGNGATTDNYTPVSVTGLASGVTKLSLGSEHTCAIHSDAVKCWGNGYYGKMGDGTGSATNSSPRSVTGLTSNVSDLDAGAQHTCAVQSTALYCWGKNDTGQLGDNSGMTQSVPVLAIADSVVQVSGGTAHTCALLSGSNVKCWGFSTYGVLTDGTTSIAVPTDVGTFSASADRVHAGHQYTCVEMNDNRVECFGKNDMGQNGNGTTTSIATPRYVTAD